MVNTLCPPCQAARSCWLDYRLPRSFGIAHGSGAPHDVSAAGTSDRRGSRFEEWQSTIQFNRDLIARTCREQRHAATAAEEPPAVVQLPLPVQWEVAA